LGEVRNLTDTPVEMVQVQVSLYNQEGVALAYQAAFTLLDQIGARGRAPFAILFDQGPARFSTYQIVPLSAVPARSQGRLSLQLTASDLQGQAMGQTAYAVQGRVRNEDQVALESVAVVVILYNAEGQVLGIRKVTPENGSLLPGATSSFEAVFLGLGEQATRYAAQAQGLRKE
jgi:hypothetical protein